MKEWCVVQYRPNHMMDVRFGNALRDGTSGIYTASWIETQRAINLFDAPLTSEHQLFFVNNEQDADRLMVELARRNAGYEYGKAQVRVVAQTVPTEPVLARFTPQGLLPA